MAHLVDYEEARGEEAKALAAVEVVKHKSSKRLAWSWAETAAEHAEAAGIANAFDLLGTGRWPETDALADAVRNLTQEV